MATATYFLVLGINYHDRFYNYCPEADVICIYEMDDFHFISINYHMYKISLSMSSTILSMDNITLTEEKKEVSQ